MYRAKCSLKSISPVSFSRRFEAKSKEKPDWEYELKTWQKKAHTNGDGEVVIPGIMFKAALISGAKLSGANIPGQGKATYTSRFKAGVIVENDINLGIKPKELDYEDVFVDSQGGRGGTQVLKRFPVVKNWKGELICTITLDRIIKKSVFEEFIKLAGQIAGVGRFRAERGGNKGRFSVEGIEFEDIE